MRHFVNRCRELPLENMSEWTKEEDMSREMLVRMYAQVKSYSAYERASEELRAL
jgi:hypothetical protein